MPPGLTWLHGSCTCLNVAQFGQGMNPKLMVAAAIARAAMACCHRCFPSCGWSYFCAVAVVVVKVAALLLRLVLLFLLLLVLLLVLRMLCVCVGVCMCECSSER